MIFYKQDYQHKSHYLYMQAMAFNCIFVHKTNYLTTGKDCELKLCWNLLATANWFSAADSSCFK